MLFLKFKQETKVWQLPCANDALIWNSLYTVNISMNNTLIIVLFLHPTQYFTTKQLQQP